MVARRVGTGLAAVVDGAKIENLLHVAPAALDFQGACPSRRSSATRAGFRAPRTAIGGRQQGETTLAMDLAPSAGAFGVAAGEVVSSEISVGLPIRRLVTRVVRKQRLSATSRTNCPRQVFPFSSGTEQTIPGIGRLASEIIIAEP
ncbi:hypothetical protein ACFWBS_59740 [Streptomyces mirabilis]|uniref:hypothetical protein n=1 Tax=Streptomyces mirabilis TaxID=68239 RepID=UPI00365CD699